MIAQVNLTTLTLPSSRLQQLIVDRSSNGQVYVYISDADTHSIIVYNVEKNQGHRIYLPDEINFKGNRKNVLYMAYVKQSKDTSFVYFTCLGSERLFSINTEYLKGANIGGCINDVGIKHDKKMVILGTDNGSSIFFRDNKGKN